MIFLNESSNGEIINESYSYSEPNLVTAVSDMNEVEHTLFYGGIHKGEARQGARIWPFTIFFNNYDKGTGECAGVIDWTTLNSTHKIIGSYSNGKLEFKEVSYITRGRAHLNCVYKLEYNSAKRRFYGPSYEEGGARSGGTAWFALPTIQAMSSPETALTTF